jgi:hypothetical protein
VSRIGGPGGGLRHGQGSRQSQNARNNCQTLHRNFLSVTGRWAAVGVGEGSFLPMDKKPGTVFLAKSSRKISILIDCDLLQQLLSGSNRPALERKFEPQYSVPESMGPAILA